MSASARWDAKHAAAGAPGEPDACVLRWAGAPGRAVDLACGTGRHALALAERGFEVEAWDFSPVALERVAAHAAERGLAVLTRVVDLAAGLPVDAPTFDLVVLTRFLDRGLYARLQQLVAPGGRAIVTTFSEDWPGPHPRPEFRLRRGELARGLPGLSTLDSLEQDGLAALHAKREGSGFPGPGPG